MVCLLFNQQRLWQSQYARSQKSSLQITSALRLSEHVNLYLIYLVIHNRGFIDTLSQIFGTTAVFSFRHLVSARSGTRYDSSCLLSLNFLINGGSDSFAIAATKCLLGRCCRYLWSCSGGWPVVTAAAAVELGWSLRHVVIQAAQRRIVDRTSEIDFIVVVVEDGVTLWINHRWVTDWLHLQLQIGEQSELIGCMIQLVVALGLVRHRWRHFTRRKSRRLRVDFRIWSDIILRNFLEAKRLAGQREFTTFILYFRTHHFHLRLWRSRINEFRYCERVASAFISLLSTASSVAEQQHFVHLLRLTPFSEAGTREDIFSTVQLRRLCILITDYCFFGTTKDRVWGRAKIIQLFVVFARWMLLLLFDAVLVVFTSCQCHFLRFLATKTDWTLRLIWRILVSSCFQPSHSIYTLLCKESLKVVTVLLRLQVKQAINFVSLPSLTVLKLILEKGGSVHTRPDWRSVQLIWHRRFPKTGCRRIRSRIIKFLHSVAGVFEGLDLTDRMKHRWCSHCFAATPLRLISHWHPIHCQSHL